MPHRPRRPGFPAASTPLLAALVAALAACSNSVPENTDPAALPSDPAGGAAATITAADMLDRVGVLAHDSMQGRDTPSPGLEAAAAYLSTEFAAMGLRPGGEDGGWLQRYPYPLRELHLPGASVELGGTVLALGRDVAVEPGRTAAGAAAGLGMVFAGARIHAAADGAGSPFADRLVVVRLPGGPPALGGRPDRDWRTRRSAALRAADAAGAAGVIFVLDPAWSPADLEAYQRSAARPQRTLGEPRTALYLAHPAAERLFARAGVDLTAPVADRPVPLPGMTARLQVSARTLEDARPPNVVAILPGSDPVLRDTYVVFSAHMDHVGIGRPDATGDSIYNGADDDASGTAALLEVAEAFAALPRAPARSLIFLAVSGEEKGLLGSSWFADNPTVPLESMVANINVDMIARNAPDTIVVIGQEYSSLGPLVQDVAEDRGDLGLTVAEDMWPQERFFFRSDHFNFARKDIPALFFFAGTHPDYHRPSDEVETIDEDKAARVARLVFHTALRIAEDREAPRWTPEGLREVRALTR